jgi:sigma-B regulation protein RsbU (phosphoserine phosphatase)
MGLDLTHFGFTGSALVFSLTIFRYKMFDVRSMARDIVIEEMTDGIIVVDEYSQIIDMNPAAKRMFGSPAFIALGMTAENAAVTWTELTASAAPESHEGNEIYLGDRAYRVDVSALSDGMKRVRGRVLFIVDVTEEKRAREIIGKSEEHFRDLYENAPGAYFAVGTDGIIELCNGRAAELLGSSREQLAGRSIFDFFPDTDNGRRAAKKIYEESGAGSADADRELEMRRADGTVVWVSLTVKPVAAADGRTAERRIMAVDITARKEMERDRELLIGQLQQALHEIKQLSGLLHVCSGCRRIRDEAGAWVSLESFVSQHTEADFSHGICPECREKLYPKKEKA